MSCVGDTVEQFLEAVSEIHYVEIAQHVCESFRKEVSPTLHLLPKQFIHGDLKPHNILLIPVENNNVVHEIGFIDFGFLNYSCRIFDVSISLMQILNVARLIWILMADEPEWRDTFWRDITRSIP